ncbi:hypothetical protein EMCRGX_G028399 [Ephydatia muelleri]
MPSRNQKKRSKQRAEYLQKREDILSQENKAKARARYKADPEKKKASVRDTYKADPEKKKASVRDTYKADPGKKKASVRDTYNANAVSKRAAKRQRYQEGVEKNRAAKRQRYQEDVEENRAAKRQRYQEGVEENRAANRRIYRGNSATIKAARRSRYWKGRRTTTTTQSYSLFEPNSRTLAEYGVRLEKAILRDSELLSEVNNAFCNSHPLLAQKVVTRSARAAKWDRTECYMAEQEERKAVRFSARPPARFAKGADFNLWVKRLELYFREAKVPDNKRGEELVALLEDDAFRVVSQSGFVSGDGVEYEEVKKCLQEQYAPKGVELEWQRKLHSAHQERPETLLEFSGRLRMLADKAYPSWSAERRLEMAQVSGGFYLQVSEGWVEGKSELDDGIVWYNVLPNQRAPNFTVTVSDLTVSLPVSSFLKGSVASVTLLAHRLKLHDCAIFYCEVVWTDEEMLVVWTDEEMLVVWTGEEMLVVWTDEGMPVVWTGEEMLVVWTGEEMKMDPGSGHGSGGGGTGTNTVAVLLLLLLLLLLTVRAALLLVAVRAALLLVAVRAALLLVAVRAALLLVAVGAALLLLAADGGGAALHLTESIETKCKDLVFTFFVLSKQSALFGR